MGLKLLKSRFISYRRLVGRSICQCEYLSDNLTQLMQLPSLITELVKSMFPEGSKSAKTDNIWDNLNSKGRTPVRTETDEGYKLVAT